MTAIIITVKGRPNLLWQCLESLKRANLKDCMIVIIDDCSQDIKVTQQLWDLVIPGVEIKRIFNSVNLGVKVSLRLGLDYALAYCDYFLICDGDSMVRHDFVDKIRALPKDSIATGFHCTTRNRDGSERHRIVDETEDYYQKLSVGGISMGFTKQVYFDHVEPALIGRGNFDHEACKSLARAGKFIYSVKESVVQHLGVNHSAMNHIGVEMADEADDFYLYDLPQVTLLGASSDYDGLKHSIDICRKHIRFGEVQILSHIDGPDVTLIPQIKSKAEYNVFILKRLAPYINTSHFLLVQPDSWILNPSAWDNKWLEYDNIGSIWHWYDSYRGYNGGFTLRTKHLMDACHKDDFIQPVNDHLIRNYEEDHLLGKIYRDYLEDKHKIKFAPEEEAEKFACEYHAVRPPNNRYKGQFGFHNFGNVDYTDFPIDEPKPFRK